MAKKQALRKFREFCDLMYKSNSPLICEEKLIFSLAKIYWVLGSVLSAEDTGKKGTVPHFKE